MILKLDIHGNPHIGLFIKLLEDYAIVSSRVEDKIIKKLEENDLQVLKTNSSIIGPYLLESNDKIFVSKNVPEELINILKKIKDLELLEGRKNLIGNLFVIGKNGILYSRGADKKLLEDLLKKVDLPLIKLKIPEYPAFGGLVKVYKDKALISQYIPNKFYEKIKEVLGVNTMLEGSVNFGSPYVKYGIELNDKVMLIGSKTTGHELLRIEEVFGEYFKYC